MVNLSSRYNYAITKKYDGISKGSSSLWGVRMIKAYGVLSKKLEHQIEYNKNTKFDYSKKQISIARRLRSGYYKRILHPKDIFNVLYYSPVVLDVEIFDSIFYDRDGIITMPDEDDKKEEFSHCFTIFGYNKEKDSFKVDSNWPEWGNKGFGFIPLEYLNKYFITAFVSSHFPKLLSEKRREISRKKIKISNKKYYFHTFLENNFGCDNRPQLNIEVINAAGDLVGWSHFAIDKNKVIELLDVFVLEEFRCQGIGSTLIEIMINFKVNSVSIRGFTGYIAAQDLINNREEIVKSFLLKNGLTVFVNKSQFKDARFKIGYIE